MKEKRIKILSLIVLILIILLLIFVKNQKQNKQITSTENNIQYDNENGIYYIKNEVTGEVIANSIDETGLQIYIDNPNYNPNPIDTRMSEWFKGKKVFGLKSVKVKNNL